MTGRIARMVKTSHVSNILVVEPELKSITQHTLAIP